MYIRNDVFLIELSKSNDKGEMTNGLAMIMMAICEGLMKRPNFRGYSYRDDLEACAIINLTKVWHKFDATKFKNPHAYFTRVAWNAIVQEIKKEKKLQDIRDNIRLANGLLPSFAKQFEDKGIEDG